jgi:heptosyltransferase-2
VWGNTVPEFGMYPYLTGVEKFENNIIIEVKNLKCRPCSKIGYDMCPKGHFNCMNKIDENEIIRHLN